ncbi:MAG: histidine kinase [Armatimonadota bacterium]|nr:histidine kinase [Armatimonadota bacterium]
MPREARMVAATARNLRWVPALGTAAHAHALANTLSLVAGVVRRRPHLAEDLLVYVAGYIRGHLRPAGPLVRLADELDTALGYLAIERARFGSRLRVTVDCERESREALVPPLLVQPLVENAVRHGVARRAGGARVRVSARVRPPVLLVAVADDGPGIDRRARSRPGLGLVALRMRLEGLWGPLARVRVLSRPGRGTIAAISLPLTRPP